MKKSNYTIGNRTRDLPACSLNQLRHRVPRICCNAEMFFTIGILKVFNVFSFPLRIINYPKNIHLTFLNKNISPQQRGGLYKGTGTEYGE